MLSVHAAFLVVNTEDGIDIVSDNMSARRVLFSTSHPVGSVIDMITLLGHDVDIEPIYIHNIEYDPVMWGVDYTPDEVNAYRIVVS